MSSKVILQQAYSCFHALKSYTDRFAFYENLNFSYLFLTQRELLRNIELFPFHPKIILQKAHLAYPLIQNTCF